MGNDTSDTQKDDPEQVDTLLKFSNGENLSGKDGLLKSHNSSSQKNPVSNDGMWLQIVKDDHKGSFLRGNRPVNSKIPRHIVSLDEKYLRRCLELIHISAVKSTRCSFSVNLAGAVMTGISSYPFGSPVILRENAPDVPQFVLELPSLAGGSCGTVIVPTVVAYEGIMHMIDKPLLHTLGAMGTGKGNDDIKGLVSGEVARSPHWHLMNSGEKGMAGSQARDYRSEDRCKRVVSVSSSDSTCFSSEFSSSSASATVSRGTLQFTMNSNGLPHFIFSLDDRKERFIASLSNAESGALEQEYLIYMRRGNNNESHLVGKIKVSTLFSVPSSSPNYRIMEREFVLFSDCRYSHTQCPDTRKNRGLLPKKVVDAFKNTRASRQRSISRFSRASSIPDFCSFQEPNYDLEPVNLLENDLPPNLESLAIVVKEQIPEEQPEEILGGWGMKFLKKQTSLPQTGSDASESSKLSTSVVVIIPSGIHGGPRKRDGGPSGLIQRWKSGGICDCGGWDLGCPLTILNGQPRKDQTEGQCNLFELFTERTKPGTEGLKIVNVHDGLYFVQLQPEISVLQSFSIAVAYIHSQNQRLRPPPPGRKMYRSFELS